MSTTKDISRSSSPCTTSPQITKKNNIISEHDKMNNTVISADSTGEAPSPGSYPDTLKDKYRRSEGEEMDLSVDSRDSYTNGIQENGDRSKYLSSPTGNGLTENGEMAERSLHDIASMARHHHLGLMRNDTVSSETSKLLRGILQGKEKRLSMGNGMDMVDSDEQDMLSRMREGMAMLRSGSFDTDLDSMQSNSPADMSSQEDSDQENQVGPNGYDCAQSEGGDCKDENKDENGGDSNEAKRARVENIITSMRMTGPYKPLCESGQAGLEKRSKRKQYMPLQHDSNSMEPSPKMKKTERDVLRTQLKLMQNQLTDMHARYMELFEHGSEQPPQNMAEYHEFMEKQMSALHGADKGMFKSPHPITNLADAPCLVDPMSLFRPANKFEKEHESMTKANPLKGDTPADLDHLAKMLKAEISNSVGSLVDNIVAKFAQKQQKPPTPRPQSKPSTPHNNNNNCLPETPLKEIKLPTRMMPSPMDREQPLCMPKQSRTKVTDKIMPPLIDNRLRTFSELVRNHPPLFPPPPYFPATQLPPAMQPLFPKEPEQTEPMALVVNTPKKKRTKVTDTRLSPRAARALLQEGAHPLDMEKMHDMHHHPAMTEGGYPMVPITLPTSVAIPNPSLQHSDVLAMYSHGHGEHPFTSDGRPMSHSPLMGDHGSPNTAHTPTDNCNLAMALIKAESEGFNSSFHEHHPQHPLSSLPHMESYDGMQMISFLLKSIKCMCMLFILSTCRCSLVILIV